ncbi:hypothetical protein M5E87_27070 [Flavonifractor plautii]|nr:hypothetical protein M5E87_27070 [Flavonifractor plautii]
MLYVRPDGSFSGTFSDTTWEEYGGSTRAVLLCSEFTGQFTEPVRVNDYTYSVRIARIDYERAVGEEAFADGFHYYYTEPRGLEDTEELLIYLPGAPLGELPQEFRGWVDHGDQGGGAALLCPQQRGAPAGIFQPESGTGDHLQPDQRPG